MATDMEDDSGQADLPMRGQAAVVDVISALMNHDGRFPAREQKVADFVKNNLDQITDMPIAKVAEAAEVSTPTVIRFCRTLGCDGFREFKLRLAQNLAVSRQYLQPDPGMPNPAEAPLDLVLTAIYGTATALRQQIDNAALSRAGQIIADCRYLVTAGIGGGSSMLAEEAANRFFRLGIPSTAVSDSYLLQMRAATLGPKDALLLFSSTGEADAVVAAAIVARSYGAETIGLSHAESRLLKACSLPIGLDLPEDAQIFKPTASRYAYLAALDAMALAAANQAPERTRENLRRIRASLTAYHGMTGPQPLGD